MVNTGGSNPSARTKISVVANVIAIAYSAIRVGGGNTVKKSVHLSLHGEVELEGSPNHWVELQLPRK